MACSFSNAKVLSGLITKAIKGRGFASAAAVRSGGSGSGMIKKTREEIIVGTTDKVSWVPDPRTGFYRPENVVQQIDVAELRATLLKKH